MKHWEASGLINLSVDYIIQRNFFKALKNGILALKLARELRIERLEFMSLQLFRDMFITMFLNSSARTEYFRDKSTIDNNDSEKSVKQGRRRRRNK